MQVSSNLLELGLIFFISISDSINQRLAKYMNVLLTSLMWMYLPVDGMWAIILWLAKKSLDYIS